MLRGVSKMLLLGFRLSPHRGPVPHQDVRPGSRPGAAVPVQPRFVSASSSARQHPRESGLPDIQINKGLATGCKKHRSRLRNTNQAGSCRRGADSKCSGSEDFKRARDFGRSLPYGCTGRRCVHPPKCFSFGF